MLRLLPASGKVCGVPYFRKSPDVLRVWGDFACAITQTHGL